jgi:hypothetical protein
LKKKKEGIPLLPRKHQESALPVPTYYLHTTSGLAYQPTMAPRPLFGPAPTYREMSIKGAHIRLTFPDLGVTLGNYSLLKGPRGSDSIIPKNLVKGRLVPDLLVAHGITGLSDFKSVYEESVHKVIGDFYAVYILFASLEGAMDQFDHVKTILHVIDPLISINGSRDVAMGITRRKAEALSRQAQYLKQAKDLNPAAEPNTESEADINGVEDADQEAVSGHTIDNVTREMFKPHEKSPLQTRALSPAAGPYEQTGPGASEISVNAISKEAATKFVKTVNAPAGDKGNSILN